MTIPEMSLLAFAVWTIVVPLSAIGYYRLSRIATGRAAFNTFHSDAVEGEDWYRRAMRAHANCVENLPVFCTLVVLMTFLHAGSRSQDAFATTVFVGRVAQTSVHMGWVETPRSVGIRFTCFLIQIICMLELAINLVVS